MLGVLGRIGIAVGGTAFGVSVGGLLGVAAVWTVLAAGAGAMLARR